jgi:4-hydroxybenzoate polyprenyltransferase
MNQFITIDEEVSTMRPALCVDLDGTLIKSDCLWDTLFTLLRRKPLVILRSLGVLFSGLGAFKAEIAQYVMLDPSTLPYNEPLLHYLRAEHRQGRELYLATGTNEVQAKGIADHLGIFKGVFASHANLNLRGENKLRMLGRQFSACGFDYIGNAWADIPVLTQAKNGMLANPSVGLRTRLRRHRVAIKRTFEDCSSWSDVLLKTIRVRQWPKNILVFAPIIFAHQLFDHAKLLFTFVAFISFSLVASSVYILNDLVDVEADRHHPHKRNRPFAAGHLSAPTGLVVMFILILLASALTSKLPVMFSMWLSIYFLGAVLYCLLLKRIVLVDVFVLASLYAVRMIAGGVASSVPVSPWLGAFAIFIFLSLAIVKRYVELDNLRNTGLAPANERGYEVADIEQLRSFGTSSGYAAVVVFALYINNPDIGRLYAHSHRLWLLTPILIYWISRIWLLAHRGKLNDDPVVFALRDQVSLYLGVVACVILRSAF